jgi:hypothetical protein
MYILKHLHGSTGYRLHFRKALEGPNSLGYELSSACEKQRSRESSNRTYVYLKNLLQSTHAPSASRPKTLNLGCWLPAHAVYVVGDCVATVLLTNFRCPVKHHLHIR